MEDSAEVQKIFQKNAERNVPGKEFRERCLFLYKDLNLQDKVPNIDKIITTANEFLQEYSVPDEFSKDDINLGLILGGIEKLSQNGISPFYKHRVENFLLRLIQPVADRKKIDPSDLWGKGLDSGGLDEKETRKYVESNIDMDETSNFLEKYSAEIEDCKASWREKGRDLEIEVFIVNDDPMTFRKKTGAAGFINIPDQEELAGEVRGKTTVTIVLLKGHSSDVVNMVLHELYHVKDFGNMVRRGYQNGILESVDELHTEFAVGNYVEQEDPESFLVGASYFTLKQFWDKFTFMSGVDFDTLSNREGLLRHISEEFGLSGLIDLSFLNAHGGGKATVFETFFNSETRPILDLLIDREKLKMREANKRGDLQDVLEDLEKQVGLLGELMTFREGSSNTSKRNKILSEMVPSTRTKVYSVLPNEDGGLSLGKQTAKKLVLAFARAVALGELVSLGEVQVSDKVSTVVNSIKKVPFLRKKVGYDIDREMEESIDRLGKWGEEGPRHSVTGLFHDLIYDMNDSIDFSFSLVNENTRKVILGGFLNELDKLSNYVLKHKNKNYPSWFIDGLFRYNVPHELKELAVEYLSEQYPQLKSTIVAKKVLFDSRKHTSGNMSL